MDLPVEALTPEEIAEWKELQATLPGLKDREMSLRRKIFASLWKVPKEGTNNHTLGELAFKGVYKLKREVDEAMLAAKQNDLIEMGLDMNELVKSKTVTVYSLNTKAYKALPEEHQRAFDAIIDTRPEAPTLEILKAKDE